MKNTASASSICQVILATNLVRVSVHAQFFLEFPRQVEHACTFFPIVFPWSTYFTNLRCSSRGTSEHPISGDFRMGHAWHACRKRRHRANSLWVLDVTRRCRWSNLLAESDFFPGMINFGLLPRCYL